MRRSRRRTAAISAKGLSAEAANGRLASQVADRTSGVQSPPTEEGSGSHRAGTALPALPAPSLGARSYGRRSRPGVGETSRCRYSVARPTPIVAAISVTVLPPSSICRATRSLPAVITERPATDPAPGPRGGQALVGVLRDQTPDSPRRPAQFRTRVRTVTVGRVTAVGRLNVVDVRIRLVLVRQAPLPRSRTRMRPSLPGRSRGTRWSGRRRTAPRARRWCARRRGAARPGAAPGGR